MQTQNEIAGALRLSPQQERLWAIRQGDDQPHYRVQAAVRIDGAVEPERLSEAVRLVVARHEILRTTYDADGSARLAPAADAARAFTLERHELSGLSAREQEKEVATLFTREVRRPFDLQRGPLVRLSLLTRTASSSTLLVGMPALCADVASLKNFVRDVSECYAQSTAKEHDAEPVQYADFSEWQSELIGSEDARRESEYWRRQMRAAKLSARLPYERSRATDEAFTPESHRAELSSQTAAEVEALAARCQVPASLLMLACWQVLLSRLTGQTDLVIGTAFDGRNYDDFKAALGAFTKYLPVGGSAAPRVSFREHLKQLAEAVGAASGMQEYFSWSYLSEDGRGFGPADFFPFVFDYEDPGAAYSPDTNLSFYVERCYACLDRYKLRLACARTTDGLTAELHYDAALFRREDVERLSREFQTLLSDALARPEAAPDELNILSDVDRSRLLFDLNSTKSDYPAQTPVHHLFEAQAERTPERIALTFEATTLTYRELNARANRLARHLRALGVGPEVLVGLCLERSPEMVVGLLAVLKAGGAYVPLDPAYPSERLAFMLEDAGVFLVLTQDGLVENLPARSAKTFRLDADIHLLAPYDETNPGAAAEAGNLMYVIYTSGSTGKSKGVMVTHQSACNRLWWSQAAYPLDAEDRVMQIASISFDFSVWEIFGPLIAGAQVVLARPGGHQDSGYLVGAIRERGVTAIHFVPSMMQVLLGEPGVEELDSLKRVFCGGEALPTPLAERFRQLLGAQLYNQYGPTETTVDVTFLLCPAGHERPTIPIGRPVANTQAYILDRRLEPLPVGQIGELYIGGDNLARGYLRRPALTAEKFIPNPFSDEPGTRLYRTGDLAQHLTGGEIEFAGREDTQVKLRGVRIELGEVEAVLRRHPAVADAVADVLEDAQGHKRLTAYTVTKPQHASPSLEEWRTHIEGILPEYMIPSAFVVLDALPLSPNGKLDRRALPPPDDALPPDHALYDEPRTPVEQALAEIWAQVLGVAKVGIHDNFFGLGGDSILSIQIIARANRSGLRLTPRQMFLHQTVAQLASVVGTTAPAKVEQGAVAGEAPLTPIQQLFFESVTADPHHFNQALMLKLRADTDAATLRRSLQRLLDHHDALRMRYRHEAAGWRQFNAADETLSWESVSLRHLGNVEDKSAAIEAHAARVQASLNLSEGPLLRAVHFDLGAGEQDRLLLVVHHLCVDGVSWRILLEDLELAYARSAAGQEVTLPEKTTSYKQWAEESVRAAQTAPLRDELAYWVAQPWAQARPLPVDTPGGGNLVLAARSVEVALTPGETDALLRRVPEAYQTRIDEVLVAALGRALARWGVGAPLVVEVEGHGREEVGGGEGVDVTRTVGWFTSVYPVLAGGREGEGVGEGLKRVKEQLRGVPRRGVGYGLLRYLSEDAEVREQMRRIPRGDVSFNYLGRFDQEAGGDAPLQLSDEPAGPLHSERGTRRYLLTVDSMVTGGKLGMSWTYSEDVHRRATVERLAEEYIKSLREIIAHCESAGAQGFTPSDFPEANLSQAELDFLISSISLNQ